MSKKFTTLFLYPLAFLSFVYVIFLAFYFISTDELPPPFFYNNADLFMDYFNVNYHSSFTFQYAFGYWKTIYTPFQILIAATIDYFSVSTSGAASYRQENLSQVYIIIFIAFLATILNYFSNLKNIEITNGYKFPVNQVCLFAVLLLSFPILYAVSRGNYILLSAIFFTSFLLFNHKIIKAIFFSLAILIKPYLVLLIFYYVIKKDYRSIFYVFIFLAIVMLLSAALFPENNVLILFIKNYLSFGDNDNFLIQGINYNFGLTLPISVLGSLLDIDYSNVVLFARLFLVVNLSIFVFRNHKKLDDNALILILILHILLLFNSTGGYALIFILPLLHVVYKTNNKFLFVTLFLIFYPFDLIIYESVNVQISSGLDFIAGVNSNFSLFALARPVLILFLTYGILYNYEHLKTDL